MAEYPSANRATFTYSEGETGIAEMRSTFNIAVKIHENNVKSWLADVPYSKERAALLSLSYNGVLNKSTSLNQAIIAGNRAEAWFEIRYNCNKGSLDATPPYGVNGIAKRRFYEAEVFSLYESGDQVKDKNEALQVYRMFTAHRDKILKYEAAYGNLYGKAGSRGDWVAEANNDYGLNQSTDYVNTLVVELQFSAENLMQEYIKNEYGVAQDFNYLNIQVTSATNPILHGEDTTTRTGSNEDLLIGRDIPGYLGVDSLYGGDGNDLLIGLDGNDYLVGGKGDDILVGGKGLDTYVWNPGDGNDRIIEEREADGKIHAIIQINNAGLSWEQYVAGGFLRDGTSNIWTMKASDGSIITLTLNSPWKLVLADGSTLEIGDFQDGDFGIKLIEIPELLTIPTFLDPEIDGITKHGDLKPVEFRDANNNIYYKYDENNNIIVHADQSESGRNDTLYGTGAGDYLLGHAGNDSLQGKAGNDWLEGGSGTDTLSGNEGDDLLLGGEGNDSLNGGVGNDHVEGGSGEDTLVGDAGNDLLFGGEDKDRLFGGVDNDLVDGGSGNDHLFAEEQKDMAILIQEGETGTGTGARGDLLGDEEGDDLLLGGAGNDVLMGGAGADGIYGGAGDDVIEGDFGLSSAYSSYTYDDWSVEKTVTLENDITVYSRNYLRLFWQEAATDSQGGDTIFAGAGNDWVFSQGGNDFIDTGSGDDVVFAEAGDDTIFGRGGNDSLNGDDGVFADGPQGDDCIDGGEGNDGLSGDGGSDILIGGAGNDHLSGDGSRIPEGLHGTDYLDGGDGDDTLVGGEKDDILYGGSDNDKLYGDNGNFTGTGKLTDDFGDDLLFGGAGNDVILGSGTDDYFRRMAA